MTHKYGMYVPFQSLLLFGVLTCIVLFRPVGDLSFVVLRSKLLPSPRRVYNALGAWEALKGKQERALCLRFMAGPGHGLKYVHTAMRIYRRGFVRVLL